MQLQLEANIIMLWNEAIIWKKNLLLLNFFNLGFVPKIEICINVIIS